MTAAVRVVLQHWAAMDADHLPHAVKQRVLLAITPVSEGVFDLCQPYVEVVGPSREFKNIVSSLNPQLVLLQNLRLSATPLTPQSPLRHAMVDDVEQRVSASSMTSSVQ